MNNKAKQNWKEETLCLLADYHTYLTSQYDTGEITTEDFVSSVYFLSNFEGRIVCDGTLDAKEMELIDDWQAELHDYQQSQKNFILELVFHFHVEQDHHKGQLQGIIKDDLEMIGIKDPTFIWLADDPNVYDGIQLLCQIKSNVYKNGMEAGFQKSIYNIIPFPISNYNWKEKE